MIHTVAILGVVFLLAFLTESLTEYVFGTPFDKYEKLKPHKWLLMYVSAAVGVGLAFFYRLDIVSLLGDVLAEQLAPSWVGFVLTGLGIGRGANWLHQVVQQYFPAKG